MVPPSNCKQLAPVATQGDTRKRLGIFSTFAGAQSCSFCWFFASVADHSARPCPTACVTGKPTDLCKFWLIGAYACLRLKILVVACSDCACAMKYSLDVRLASSSVRALFVVLLHNGSTQLSGFNSWQECSTTAYLHMKHPEEAACVPQHPALAFHGRATSRTDFGRPPRRAFREYL